MPARQPLPPAPGAAEEPGPAVDRHRPLRPPAAGPLGARRLALVFLGLLALAAVLRLPGWFVEVFNSDETFLATQAEVLNRGGELYLEAADRKPPLVPYLYALTFSVTGSTSLAWPRALATVAVATTGLLCLVEARRRFGARAGWIAGGLLVAASVLLPPQDGQAANFEVFMLPAMTAAVMLAARGRAVGSGVAVAVATLAKQTGAATMLPVLWDVHRTRGGRGVRGALVGFALPVLAVAVAVGPAQLFFWTTLGNGSYVGLRSISPAVAAKLLAVTVGFVAANLAVLWHLPRAWRERHRDDLDLWLLLVSAVASVTVGFRFFGHYFLQLLPPLVLLTAGALANASVRTVRRTVAFSTVVAAGFLAVGFFADRLVPDPRYRQVAAFVERNTTDRDRILVWGHVPEIYWASGREPATRFLTSGFLTGAAGGRPPEEVSTELATPGAWDLFLDDFAAHPPKYVLDTSPAGIRGSEHYPPGKFPQLFAILRGAYHYVRSIDGIAVYERVPGAPIAVATSGSDG